MRPRVHLNFLRSALTDTRPALSRSLSHPGWGLIALIALSAVTTACSKRLSEEECYLLLDRYTDKLVDQSRPSTDAPERRRLQMEARKKAPLDPEFRRCPSAVSRSQYECAMNAHNADQIERCLL